LSHLHVLLSFENSANSIVHQPNAIYSLSKITDFLYMPSNAILIPASPFYACTGIPREA